MRDDVRQRIGAVIRAYENQGFHRTGTDVDRVSGDRLADEVRQTGLVPALEEFSLSRIDPVGTTLVVNGRTIDGLPLFDGGFTPPAGVSGPLGILGGDAAIGLVELPPNAAEAGALGDARRQNRHQAIVAVTCGRRPDFARATPTASCGPSALRCCRSGARKRISLPMARGGARRLCSLRRSNARRPSRSM